MLSRMSFVQLAFFLEGWGGVGGGGGGGGPSVFRIVSESISLPTSEAGLVRSVFCELDLRISSSAFVRTKKKRRRHCPSKAPLWLEESGEGPRNGRSIRLAPAFTASR